MKHVGAIWFVLLPVLACGCLRAPVGAGHDRTVHVEQLPSLNIPRSGHALLEIGGELTVIGGHTTGFVPTATAEYLKDGKWHLVESLYPHDHAAVAKLPGGEVLVAGGMSESFGKGRSLGAEVYNPVTHSFSPVPILDRARARTSAAVLSDGTIVVCGNWCGEDDIASYSTGKGGSLIKAAVQPRSSPYILPCAPDNALILSPSGSEGEMDGPILIDRFKGDPFCDSLFLEWRPLVFEASYSLDCYSIGNDALGAYAALIPATRIEDGQAGIIKQTGENFSLLETETPIPMTSPEGESIAWSVVHTDKAVGQAYLVSFAARKERIYVCRIGYGEVLRGGKAPVTLFSADNYVHGWDLYNVLLPGGRIAFVGGNTGDNYNPVGTAFILHTEPVRNRPAAISVWPFLLLLAVGGMLGCYLLLRRRPSPARPEPEFREPVPSQGADLSSRIATLVEDRQLYLRKGLKVQDIATELATNSTYVSACINGQWGMSFPEYLTSLRIRHAKALILQYPDKPMYQVADESGFANEQSFYRSFKALTGKTPSEWTQIQNAREKEK